jgi:putative restriction endonuclease
LLLSVLDLFAAGIISDNLIEISPDLGSLFILYWSRVMPPFPRPNLAMPFFHLQTDGFWHLAARSGQAAFLSRVDRIHSKTVLRETVLGATLDEELYRLACCDRSREMLRAVLVRTYFAEDAQQHIEEQCGTNLEAYSYSKVLLTQPQVARVKEASTRLPDAVRDQGFRRAVVEAYAHRCGMCGIRVVTADGHTAVDASHIIPWSLAHDDRPANGMALCRLCHWAFDEGLSSVSDRYIVIGSRQLGAEGNLPGHLSTLIGREILRPCDVNLWPDRESFAWHRQNRLRRL